LDLGGNGLEGPLPVDIDNMVEIRHMYLDNNRFNGTIPDVLPQIGNGRIETLSLDHNEFEGNFPDQWDIRWHMGKFRNKEDSRSIRQTKLTHDSSFVSVYT
jgi:hypothetical protein